MKKIDPKDLQANAIRLIGDRWMLITAGSADSFNTMTASWGALGELWSKPVAFVFVRPQRYTYKFMEEGDKATLSFLDEQHREAYKICGSTSGRDVDKVAKAGLTPFETENGCVCFREAKIILECRTLYAAPFEAGYFRDAGYVDNIYPAKDFHKMYIMEITGAWTR